MRPLSTIPAQPSDGAWACTIFSDPSKSITSATYGVRTNFDGLAITLPETSLPRSVRSLGIPDVVPFIIVVSLQFSTFTTELLLSDLQLSLLFCRFFERECERKTRSEDSLATSDFWFRRRLFEGLFDSDEQDVEDDVADEDEDLFTTITRILLQVRMGVPQRFPRLKMCRRDL
mmetsp:Transcript_21362/g.41870  ORF Transcript_21362/g.41870 Transcript_21362/m.41870 type:complete len:174 (+) Transcript_21362:1004-1525(+)|eukprot:CAMPEP_0171492434 /NCGR_PEP_ID=MMETSP0958-20121227/4408_1 /TAXON_ID=87120 /ORGANISM="Aurantiochytrium limacinum, Strain ATCCMYA-1381" /LENGTH=173 /DNA_ID=CAMNT_0012025953 /DNA_START=881 /DNA_END=1402 /DNA_ORIENTATION=-